MHGGAAGPGQGERFLGERVGRCHIRILRLQSATLDQPQNASKVDWIENMTNEEVIRLFREARDRDYAGLAERYRKLLKEAPTKRGHSPSGRYAEELKRLAVELKRLREIDFFDALWRGEVERLKDATEEVIALIREAGFTPVQRTTLYEILKVCE